MSILGKQVSEVDCPKVAGHALLQFFINLLPADIAWTLVMGNCWLPGRISSVGFSNEQVKLLRNVVCMFSIRKCWMSRLAECEVLKSRGTRVFFFPKTVLNPINSLVSFYCGCHQTSLLTIFQCILHIRTARRDEWEMVSRSNRHISNFRIV